MDKLHTAFTTLATAALREEVMYVIFLDLHKTYDTLDRSMRLIILEGYGVAPKARRLLTTY